MHNNVLNGLYKDFYCCLNWSPCCAHSLLHKRQNIFVPFYAALLQNMICNFSGSTKGETATTTLARHLRFIFKIRLAVG